MRADAAVSWPAFWVTLAASLTLYLTSSLDEVTWSDLPLRIAIVSGAAVGMFATMAAVLRVPWLAARGDDARWTIALVVVGAVVRGLIVGVGSAVLLHTPPQVSYRIVASVMALVPLVIVTAAVVADVRAQAARRAALAVARRRVVEAEHAADADLTETHATIVARVREVLEQAVRGEAAPDVAVRLREQVDTVIRPLSHQLATSVPQWTITALAATPHVRWRALWRDATLGRPFQPVVTAGLGFVVSLAGISNRVGPAAGVVITALLAVMAFAAFAVAGRLWQRVLVGMPGPGLRLVLAVAVDVAALALIAATVAAAFAAVGADPRPIAAAILAFGFAFTAAIACMQAAVANLRAVTAELAAATVALDRAVARVQAIAWRQQRVLALAIHGPLQAHVAAAAARIEAAVAAGRDPAASIDDARRSVLEALDALDLGSVGSGDVLADLRDVAEAWEGVCDVLVELDAGLAARIDAEPATARVIVDVCTEACSNAVRHADATVVTVAVDDVADGLGVRVWNDGAPMHDGPDGLGTRLLDEVALRWERTVGDGHTSLEVLLPALPDHDRVSTARV